MASRFARRAGWLALVAAGVVASAALADGPGDDGAGAMPAMDAPGGAGKAGEVAEARAILRDLLELGGSLDRGKGKGRARGRRGVEEISDADLLAKAGRPSKTITAATLDSAAIDAMLDKTLAEAKVNPAKLTSDEEFIRRVTLDVTGDLPSPEAVVKFRQSRDKDKRPKLIDALLASPDHGENWGRYWRDVVQFHATAQNTGLVNFPNLASWMAEQINKNRPWDEVATELITGTGLTSDDGSAVFAAAQMGQAVELAGEVSRVFLGVQIQCAQCHDHPSDPWKREQFHEFAAFFGGVVARNNREARCVEVIDRPARANYRMPDLKDPQKSVPVEPRFFLAKSESPLPQGLPAAQRRMLAASYVTGQDNPWFARAFVNRMWFALLGDGFYTPVDDLGPTREGHATEVLDRLADAWQQGGYDVRWLFRTILNTRAYQREFRPVSSAAGRTPFAANCSSRLRADQIMDALVRALDLDFQDASGLNKKGEPAAKGKGADPKVVQRMALRGQAGPRGMFNLVFGVDPSAPVDEVLGTIPQALYFMNSPVINQAVRAVDGKVLGNILAGSPSERAALEALYLRVLARSPTADEVRTCGKYLQSSANRREAFEDILWALVNSTEFLSRK